MAHTGRKLATAWEAEEAKRKEAAQPRLVSQSALGSPLESGIDQRFGWGRHSYADLFPNEPPEEPSSPIGQWVRVDFPEREVALRELWGRGEGNLGQIQGTDTGPGPRDCYVIERGTFLVLVPIEFCTICSPPRIHCNLR